MKIKLPVSLVLLIATLLGSYSWLYAWGVWAHQHINRAAVFALPAEMRTFFYNHADFMTEESVIPDVRKYTLNDRTEFARHFIALEAFGNQPLETLPKTWAEVKATYPDSLLQKNGILPWYIGEMMTKLTRAFKERKKDEILFLAADLGHYLADAQMPLHTSLNHDGQLTDQKGIHAFWEAQLPEQFGKGYNLHTGEATYISDLVAETWRIIGESHAKADTLLAIDRKLQSEFPPNQVYQLDSQGQILKNKYNQPVHSLSYAQRYHQLLSGMVERQMRAAITATANFWYTAWVNAGKPDLNLLDSEATTQSNRNNLQRELKLWKQGKMMNIKTSAEF